mmetsp:Transcript_105125/g.201792  ORF Transcript_105125/g.201792 Transcript_105125/m.201792 type:complete len:451 (-) Transcript_105125:459-1811(-)
MRAIALVLAYLAVPGCGGRVRTRNGKMQGTSHEEQLKVLATLFRALSPRAGFSQAGQPRLQLHAERAVPSSARMITPVDPSSSAVPPVDMSTIPADLDMPTVQLHKVYHDATFEYTVQHMEWVENKSYVLDGLLNNEQLIKNALAARSRFSRWPQLASRDIRNVPVAPYPQQFCSRPVQGDPGEHVYIINLARRPTKLQNVVRQLKNDGVSAKIVDAIDGDSIMCKDDIAKHGVKTIPGYRGHSNHHINLTTGEVGCFMSHFTIWRHMVDNNIDSALILEDDFDFQEDFKRRLGQAIEEAEHEDWNLFYVGRSPVDGDWRRVSEHVVEPGYTLWTLGYIIRLDAARALLDARVEGCMAPLDDYFSVAMGRYTTVYNEFAVAWKKYVPKVFRPLAVTPPLVMPYVGSMFLSDTAMLRKNLTRFVQDLPDTISIADLRQLPGYKSGLAGMAN